MSVMNPPTSLLQDLLQSLPHVQAKTYFKATLTAISHAMEDLVLESSDRPLVIANFQQERFYRQETARYNAIAERSDHVYVLAVPETALMQDAAPYATIGIDPADDLAQEWHLVIICDRYCATLVCREEVDTAAGGGLDTARQFRGFWTFDPAIARQVAVALFNRIVRYRPDLRDAVAAAQKQYRLFQTKLLQDSQVDSQLFGDRLADYLQVGQQQQVTAYVEATALNQHLAAIEQAQNNLIAIVGHELRTPLSTIRICLESMVDEPDMPQEYQKVMLDTAMGDSERLRRLIQDFLLFSRLEGNSIAWQVEAIDLSEMIALTVSSLQRMGKARVLPQVELDLPIEPVILVCDGEALQQLLNKLLENAYKFTPSSGTVTIRVCRLGDRTPEVQIQIMDTGCGIESSRLERIFDRFYQEEGFMRRSVGGTGLGLAICRRLASSLGGRLWATSEGKGMGSQFHVVLPGAD
jgi:signal transduction histidine kinase